MKMDVRIKAGLRWTYADVDGTTDSFCAVSGPRITWTALQVAGCSLAHKLLPFHVGISARN